MNPIGIDCQGDLCVKISTSESAAFRWFFSNAKSLLGREGSNLRMAESKSLGKVSKTNTHKTQSVKPLPADQRLKGILSNRIERQAARVICLAILHNFVVEVGHG